MKITHVRVDDWSGLYIDGKLEYEGHSIRDDEWETVLTLAGVEVERESYTDRAERAIGLGGRCPATWPPSE